MHEALVKMAPVAVMHVVRPAEDRAATARRWTRPLLLAPAFGAFFQVLIFHRAPSIAWPFVVLAAAVVTRILRSRAVVKEHAAALGVDGLALDGRFLAAREIEHTSQGDDVVFVTTRSGERIELRIDPSVNERVEAVLAALARAVAAPRDEAAEPFLTSSVERQARVAYREPAFDAERCIAVAEDAAAAPRVRIAAAGLLAEMDVADDATRARIAAAAESTASPELREALEAALAARAS